MEIMSYIHSHPPLKSLLSDWIFKDIECDNANISILHGGNNCILELYAEIFTNKMKSEIEICFKNKGKHV